MTLRFPSMPEQLTKTETRILEYIAQNTESFLFAPIGQMARQLGISEATIFPFCAACGMPGL